MNTCFTFIHVGKCGGTSVISTLQENNIKHEVIHCRPVKCDHTKKYILLLRNPVDRFISSFYWRKYKNKNEKSSEYKFLHKYKCVNDLCNHLYTKSGDLNLDLHNEIHREHDDLDHPAHYAMNIKYYIGGCIDNLNSQNIISCICTETLNDDLYRIFKIRCITNYKNNAKNKLHTTNKSRDILKHYLNDDYNIIERLNQMNILTEEQYKFISK
jgi:hypothetical protein